ncbi:MAG: carboxypeptidase regulatory-like domain-containing protein [Planctomycetes bacterium]|nr:carboxypeptidase regulatory-like domain-containing protein [Planctomycetota bacterium]
MNVAKKCLLAVVAVMILTAMFVGLPMRAGSPAEATPPSSLERRARVTTPSPRADAVEILPSVPRAFASSDGNCSALRDGATRPPPAVARDASVFGRITFASDGRAASKSRLTLNRGDGGDDACVKGEADSSGDFRFNGLSAGEYSFWVTPEGEQPTLQLWLHLSEGAHVERNVVVPVGFAVVGKVTDAASGRPITDAAITALWGATDRVATNESGEYVLRGLAGEGWYVVEASVVAIGTMRQVVYVRESETVVADFALTPGRRAIGRIVDPDGEPIGGAGVIAEAIDSTDPTGTMYCDDQGSETRSDGRFEISDLRSDLRYQLVVQTNSFALVTYDFPPMSSSFEPVDFGDLVLPPDCRIQGRVTDEEGHALPDAWVWISGWNDDRFTFSGTGDPLPFCAGYHSSRTDFWGRFNVSDLPAGSFVVHATVTGRPGEVTETISLSNGEMRDGVALVFPSGLSIEGMVTDGRGVPIANAWVIAAREDDACDDANAQIQTDTKGAFRFTGVTPGHYVVRADPYSRGGIPAGTSGIILTCGRSTGIEGVVLDAEGQSSSYARVIAIQADGGLVQSSIAAPDGRFRLEVAEGSVVSLEVRRYVEGDGFYARQTTRPHGRPDAVVSGIAAGTRDVVLRFASP